MNLKPSSYIVQEGDTLASIAKNQRLPSYKIISSHPGNSSLMALRGGPDRINVGDVIVIPASPIDSLQKQIIQLERLKVETNQLHDQILYEHQQAFGTANAWSQGVDIAASIIDITRGLAGSVKKVGEILSKSGDEFTKLLTDFTGDFLKGEMKGAAEDAVSSSDLVSPITGEENMAYAFGKVVAQSYFDMTSPSYWAQRVSGVDINEVNRQTTHMIEDQRRKAIQSLDKKISDKRLKVLELSNQYGVEEVVESTSSYLY